MMMMMTTPVDSDVESNTPNIISFEPKLIEMSAVFRQSVNMEDDARRRGNCPLSRDFLFRSLTLFYELFLVWQSRGKLALKHASQCLTGFCLFETANINLAEVTEVFFLGQFTWLVKAMYEVKINSSIHRWSITCLFHNSEKTNIPGRQLSPSRRIPRHIRDL